MLSGFWGYLQYYILRIWDIFQNNWDMGYSDPLPGPQYYKVYYKDNLDIHCNWVLH